MTTQAPHEPGGLRALISGPRSNIIPVAVTIILLLLFIAAAINVVVDVNAQLAAGRLALDLQGSTNDNSFRQLQREALRLAALVNTDPLALDQEEARLQIDLLASRFFQIEAATSDPNLRQQEAEVALAFAARGDEIIDNAEGWLADPENETIRRALHDELIALERDVNQAILDFSRTTSRAVLDFSQATNRAQTAIALAAGAFFLFSLSVIYSVYLYLRQVQETEAALESIAFKDQFLAVMSHELRTPLNAIIGFLGLMKMQGPESERLPHMIDRSRANAERLLNLIDDILDISKIEAGRFELHMEPVAVADLVNRWNTQAEILSQEKGLDYQSRVDIAMPQEIMVDIDAITKIASNLLSNATKFTDEGSVRLDIEYLTDQWRIVVEDTGIGIPTGEQDTIFESFRQVDGSIRRSYGGSGLGLSIVRHLTNLMGGEVRVTSTEGKGSTFMVTLPLTQVPAAQVVSRPEPVAAA